MVKDKNSDIGKDHVKHNFESLTMMVGEPARESIARAKGLGSTVKHHRVEVPDKKSYRRILKGLPPSLHFVHDGFALRIGYSLVALG